MTHLAWWPFIVLAGAGVGVCTGLFGVGGSSVATPVLALLGAPGLIAVASPLPATIPSAAVGAIPYVRSREARTHAAAWSVLGGVPGTVAGALLSRLAGGPVLLMVSGLVLVVVGLRVILPVDEKALEKGAERRRHRALLVATMVLVGVFTGLLANGGGFLIVPLYLLVFGLRMREAVGTSLLVIVVLAIPTLVTHWALGHINWALAGEFALGQVPGSAAGGQFAHHVQGPVIRRAFGLFLIAFGLDPARPRPAAARRGDRHPAHRHLHRRLRGADDPAGLGMGRGRVGLRPVLVRCRGPGQARRLLVARPSSTARRGRRGAAVMTGPPGQAASMADFRSWRGGRTLDRVIPVVIGDTRASGARQIRACAFPDSRAPSHLLTGESSHDQAGKYRRAAEVR
jgi:uncharacterized protein